MNATHFTLKIIRATTYRSLGTFTRATLYNVVLTNVG